MGIGIQTQGLLLSKNFGDIINPITALNNLLTTLASGSIYLKEDLDFLEDVSIISQSPVSNSIQNQGFDITLDSQLLKLKDILKYNEAQEVIRPVATLKNRFDYINLVMGEPRFQGGNGLTRRTYEWNSVYPSSSSLPTVVESSVFLNADPVDTDIFWGRGSITFKSLSMSSNIKGIEGIQIFTGFFKSYQSGVHKFVINTSTNGGVVIELTDESGLTMLENPIYYKPNFTSPDSLIVNTVPLERYKFYNIKIYFLRSPGTVESKLRHDAAINLKLPVTYSETNFYYDFLYDENYLSRSKGELGYFFDNKLPLMGTNFHNYQNNTEKFSIGGAVSGAYKAIVTTGKLTVNYTPPKFYSQAVIVKNNCKLTLGRNYITNISDTSNIRPGNLVLDAGKTFPSFTYVKEVINESSVLLTSNCAIDSTTSTLFFIEHKGLKGYTQDYNITAGTFNSITNYKGDLYKPKDVVLQKSLTVGGYTSISAIALDGSLVVTRPFLNTITTAEPLVFYYRSGVDNISLDGFCTGGNIQRLVTAKTTATSNAGINTLRIDPNSIFDYEGNRLTLSQLASNNFAVSAYHIKYGAAIPNDTAINTASVISNEITLSKNLDEAIKSGTSLSITLSTPSNPPGSVSRHECFPPGETAAPFIGTSNGLATPYLSSINVKNNTLSFNKILFKDTDTTSNTSVAPVSPNFNSFIPIKDGNNLTLYLLASTNNINYATTTSTTTTVPPWLQLNVPTISGTTIGTQLGYSIDLNQAGDILIVGGIGRTYTTPSILSGGIGAIWKRGGATTWSEVTSVSATSNARAFGGYSVKLDNSGFTAIIGVPGYNALNTTNVGHGRVTVLSSSNNGTSYTTLSNINDLTSVSVTTTDFNLLNRFGASVDISGDGKRILVGAPGVDTTGTNNRGRVRAYSYGTTWTQLGGDIVGESDDDQCGTSVAINDAGTIIAVTSLYKEGSDIYGRVRVFSLIGTTWTQLGNSITGSYPGYKFGQSIDFNSAGDIIVIGSPNLFPSSKDPGIVRVLKFNSLTNKWDIYGQEFIYGSGDSATDFGESVSINSAGDIIVVGSAISTEAGRARLFNYNTITKTWVQLNNSIEGASIGSGTGTSVSINGTGDKFAVGSPYIDNSALITTAGRVMVYSTSY